LKANKYLAQRDCGNFWE